MVYGVTGQLGQIVVKLVILTVQKVGLVFVITHHRQPICLIVKDQTLKKLHALMHHVLVSNFKKGPKTKYTQSTH